jgi:hypothetical protein
MCGAKYLNVWTTAKYLNVWTTVQFPYLEICGARKWGKAKGEGGAWYEGDSCFVAADTSVQYQSHIHRPLQD